MHLRLNRAPPLLALVLLAGGGLVIGSSWNVAGEATAQEAAEQTPAAPSSPIVREIPPRNVRERPTVAGETSEAASSPVTSSNDLPSGAVTAAMSDSTGPSTNSAAPAAENETVMVMVDHAKVVRLPDRTQTVIVGNPMVADITIQRNGIIVVTGKSYGATNLIALDSAGLLLAESTISVQAPTDAVVTVQRGLARESYSCTPTCQPSLRLGDSQDYFGVVGNQATQRNTLATQR